MRLISVFCLNDLKFSNIIFSNIIYTPLQMSFIYIIHTASVCCNFFTVIICYIVIFLQYIIHIISILYKTKHIHFPDKTPTPNVHPQPGRCKTSNKVKNLMPKVQDGQVPVCGIQSDADVYVHFLPPRRLSL